MQRVRLFSLIVLAAMLSGCGYNTIQQQDEAVKAQWSEVLNQYQRRADLVPNLVETVKGYAAHEKLTLDAVIAARNAAASAQGPAAMGAAEGALSGALVDIKCRLLAFETAHRAAP